MIALSVLLGLGTTTDAWARNGRFGGGMQGHRGYGHFQHGGRHFHGYSSFGFFFGSPWPYYSSWGWPDYAYGPYYPPIVALPPSPPVYIEQQSRPAVSSGEPHYWYYCDSSRAYYPYVKDCPAGWLKIAPEPPGQEANYWYRCGNPQGYYPYVKDCPAGWEKRIPDTTTSP